MGEPTDVSARFSRIIWGEVGQPAIEKTRAFLERLATKEISESEARRLIAQLYRMLNSSLSSDTVDSIASRLVEDVGAWNERQLVRSLAIDVPEMTAATTRRLARESASAIRGVPASITQRVAPLISRAARSGLRGSAFETELAKRLNVSGKDARNIAAGAVIRVNATVTQERHAAVGIVEYIWRTVGDQYTRWWHAKLNGKKFRYDSPPVGGGAGPKDRGHPGTAPGKRGCRCQPIPVI